MLLNGAGPEHIFEAGTSAEERVGNRRYRTTGRQRAFLNVFSRTMHCSKANNVDQTTDTEANDTVQDVDGVLNRRRPTQHRRRYKLCSL